MTATASAVINCTPTATSAGILEKLRDTIHKAMSGQNYPTPGSGVSSGCGVIVDDISANNRFFVRMNTQQGTSYKDGIAYVEVGISTNRLYAKLGDGFGLNTTLVDSKSNNIITTSFSDLPTLNAGSAVIEAGVGSMLQSGVKAFGTKALCHSSGLPDHKIEKVYVTDSGSNFDFGTGDFMIAIEARLEAFSNGNNSIYDTRPSGVVSHPSPTVYVTDNGALCLYFNGGNQVTTVPGTFTLGSFHNVEVARVSGVIYLLLDGVLIGSAAHSGAVSFDDLVIGGMSDNRSMSSGSWFGYFDEFVVVKGSGGHTANFTRPTAAIDSSSPFWDNVVCLCHFESEAISATRGISNYVNILDNINYISNQVYLGEAFIVFASGNDKGFWFAVKSSYGLQIPVRVFGATRFPFDTRDYVADSDVLNRCIRVFTGPTTEGISGISQLFAAKIGGRPGRYYANGDLFVECRAQQSSGFDAIYSGGDPTLQRRRVVSAYGKNFADFPVYTQRAIVKPNISTTSLNGYNSWAYKHTYSNALNFNSHRIRMDFGFGEVFAYGSGYIPNESVLPSSTHPEWICMASNGTHLDYDTSYLFAWALPDLYDVV